MVECHIHRVGSEWTAVLNRLENAESLSDERLSEMYEDAERIRRALRELAEMGMVEYDESEATWSLTDLLTPNSA